MLRPLPVLAASTVLLAVALSGCGSGGGTSTVSTIPAGSLGATGTNIDQADLTTVIDPDDQAAAVQMTLSANDLGAGWTPHTVPVPYSQKQPKCPTFVPLQADLTLTGHAETNFSNDAQAIAVDSDVEVLKSADELKTDIGRVFVPGATTCVGYRALQSGQASGYVIGPAKAIPFPQVGEASAAYRVIFYTPKTNKPYITYDVINFASGRSLFSVNVIAPNIPAVQTNVTQIERAIVQKLVARAASAD